MLVIIMYPGPGENYRKVMRHRTTFGAGRNYLPPVKEMINYIGGKVFSNNWYTCSPV